MEKWLAAFQTASVVLTSLAVICMIVALVLSARVNAAKDARISEALTQSADAKSAVEDAKIERQRLELELKDLKEPRRIPEEAGEHISQALRQYEGQRYTFMVFEDPEARQLAERIDAVLRAAGWVREPSQIGVIVTDLAEATAGTSRSSGLRALAGYDNPEAHEAVVALSILLTQMGVTCYARTSHDLDGLEPKAILVDVGQKPVSVPAT